MLKFERGVLRVRNFKLPVSISYRLEDGSPYVEVELVYRNPAIKGQRKKAEPKTLEQMLEGDFSTKRPEKPMRKLSEVVSFVPVLRFGAYKNFEFGFDGRLFWAYDRWFRQAYGVIIEGLSITECRWGRKVRMGPTAISIALGVRRSECFWSEASPGVLGS